MRKVNVLINYTTNKGTIHLLSRQAHTVTQKHGPIRFLHTNIQAHS